MSIKVRRGAYKKNIDTYQLSRSTCWTIKTWKFICLEEVTLRIFDRGQKGPLLWLVKSYCNIKMRPKHEANTSRLSLVADCCGCHKCGPQHAHVKNSFIFFPPAKWFLSVELVPIMLIYAQSGFDLFSRCKKKGFKHDRQLMKTTGWISMSFPMNIYKSVITSVTTGDVNLLFFRFYWEL